MCRPAINVFPGVRHDSFPNLFLPPLGEFSEPHQVSVCVSPHKKEFSREFLEPKGTLKPSREIFVLKVKDSDSGVGVKTPSVGAGGDVTGEELCVRVRRAE